MFISLLVSVFFYVLISLLECVGSLAQKKQVCVTNLQNRDVDTMTGVEFERYCINLLVKTGRFNRAQMTDVTNDYGADIVAVDNEGIRWVFQCKRYSSNLNNRPIQEVIASMAHYKATKAAVITNSWFTDNAKVLGRENGVWLIDRAGFKKLEEQAKCERHPA